MSVCVLGITVLLSLTVFMLLVAEIMPATSDSVPLIGKARVGLLSQRYKVRERWNFQGRGKRKNTFSRATESNIPFHFLSQGGYLR